MYKIVKESEGIIRKITNNKTVLNLITRDVTPNVSLAVIDAQEYRGDEQANYNRIYYVIEGSLTLTFDDNRQTLELGDSCYIEKGRKYQIEGTFKAIIVSQPAFGT